jgi:hypothetical protein
MATGYDPTVFDFQNYLSGTLTSDITSGTLTLNVDTVPAPSQGILVIDPNNATAREVIFYTSKGASSVTCPSDGRGWDGSTATSHLTGTTYIMADVAAYFKGLRDGTLSNDPLRPIVAPNFVVSGGVVALSSGLVGTFSNIVFYQNGRKYSGTSIANKTYNASNDTYVDITGNADGTVTVTYTAVANNAAAPALSANNLRIAKVVTNGSAITGVTQTGSDSLSNFIYTAANQSIVPTRDDNTTITTQGRTATVHGWGYIQAGGTVNSMSKTVALPITFKTVPIIMISPAGDVASGPASLGSGGNTIQGNVTAKHYSDTVNSFVAYVAASGGSWAVGNLCYFTYTATGQIV